MNKYDYIDTLVDRCADELVKLVNESNIELAFKHHTRIEKGNSSPDFQKYYASITGSKDVFLNAMPLSDFKKQYSLQGIDQICLDNIERVKPQIFEMVSRHDIYNVYLNFFYKQEACPARNGNGRMVKTLGSFYTKVIHTIDPVNYCAVDSYIKELLKLEKESFPTSMTVISETYKIFSHNNPYLMSLLRRTFSEWEVFKNHTLSDIKLLDLALWAIGDIKKKELEAKAKQGKS